MKGFEGGTLVDDGRQSIIGPFDIVNDEGLEGWEAEEKVFDWLVASRVRQVKTIDGRATFRSPRESWHSLTLSQVGKNAGAKWIDNFGTVGDNAEGFYVSAELEESKKYGKVHFFHLDLEMCKMIQ